ncbi:MAG: ABC transporter substrate-binding protein [Acidobacteria bacterium]|nr:ABC transporter substrate-binding protein [Acidobacteriota bacterium]MCB9396450.1 ABC transporter substrate-binding protein [Acidobacteriota bacterium]
MFTCLIVSILLADKPLTFAAGYIPNVQFLPFYVALERGYYREEGIELSIDYTVGSDIFKLVAQGKIDVASADPDGLLSACQQGLPLVHVATFYQNYPLAIISKKPVHSASDLKGKRIGISGAYGSSYLGLKAMCDQLGLKLQDLDLVTIGYTQVAAMRNGTVEAVVGYANNEPVRLAEEGVETHLYKLSYQNSFPGVGFMVNRDKWEKDSEPIRAFLRATFRGLVDVVLSPKECFALVAPKYLAGVNPDPEASPEYKVLMATLPYWSNLYTQKNGFGQCDPSSWSNLSHFMEVQQGVSFKDWQDWVKMDFRWKNMP